MTTGDQGYLAGRAGPILAERGHPRAELTQEVFGPVLHIIRYKRADLGKIVDSINATGFDDYVGMEFIPRGNPLSSLQAAVDDFRAASAR